MKLSEFIKVLQDLEAEGYGELPVCLADWNEGYEAPSEIAVEASLDNSGRTYNSLDGKKTGNFISIGD